MAISRFTSAVHSRLQAALALLVLVMLTGCTVGPHFTGTRTASPDDWTSWRSGDKSLRGNAGRGALPERWWRAFDDPVLNRLQKQAFAGSPDLQSAVMRFAQARVQRRTLEAHGFPVVNLSGETTRYRQSEWGAGTRIIDAIGANREELVKILSEPFTLYQAGFDASWEPDLWGRVRRSVEAADADVSRQAALFEMARLSLASEVARNYFEVRSAQQQVRLTQDEIAALEERLGLLGAQVKGGVKNDLDLKRQQAELSGLKSTLPALLAQESASANQITLLLGANPGALRSELKPTGERSPASLPDLRLGLPSEVALRRPDIRAAEAKLHSATARIGVARADLYPSIRIGGRYGHESYLSGEFADWGSRAWSVGPSLDLPLFDHGRRKGVVQLRELEQQEAAVAYHRTVLQAWQEIDDALSGYAAVRLQKRELTARERSAREAYDLAKAQYDGGVTDFSTVLDSQRTWLQARRDLVNSEGRMKTRFVAVNKAVGNISAEAP